jgi:hypothetical protein
MNRIGAFLHCRKCLTEMPPGTAPRDWARLESGWTKEGLQIWCVRHDINVLDLDFEGQKLTRLPDDFAGKN